MRRSSVRVRSPAPVPSRSFAPASSPAPGVDSTVQRIRGEADYQRFFERHPCMLPWYGAPYTGAHRGSWHVSLGRRTQRGSATASLNFSDGVMNWSVLRGRPLSSAATTSRSAWSNPPPSSHGPACQQDDRGAVPIGIIARVPSPEPVEDNGALLRIGPVEGERLAARGRLVEEANGAQGRLRPAAISADPVNPGSGPPRTAPCRATSSSRTSPLG